jgi:hypothetical protein
MPQARREPGETAFRRARAAAGAVFRPGEGRSVDAAYPQCCTRQPTNVLEIRTTIFASERGGPRPAPAEPASWLGGPTDDALAYLVGALVICPRISPPGFFAV